MVSRRITVVPRAGLCNRLWVVACAVKYSLAHPEADVEIYWEKHKECNAHFDELFEPIPMFLPKSVNRLERFRLRVGRKENLFIPTLIQKCTFDKVLRFRWWMDRNAFDDVIKNKENIYVEAYETFNSFYVDADLGTYFIPNNIIQRRIDSIVSQFEGKTVGIHVRRTDNKTAISMNPLSRYIAVMNKEIEKNPEVRFYLASDSVEVKEELSRLFGERIITTDLFLSRSSLQGMEDAVVDLFSLAHTDYIIGSNHSSYSVVAADLFNKELILLNDYIL